MGFRTHEQNSEPVLPEFQQFLIDKKLVPLLAGFAAISSNCGDSSFHDRIKQIDIVEVSIWQKPL